MIKYFSASLVASLCVVYGRTWCRFQTVSGAHCSFCHPSWELLSGVEVGSHHGQLQNPEVGDLGVPEGRTVAMPSFSSQLRMQDFSSTA